MSKLKTKSFKYKSASCYIYIYPNKTAWVYEVRAKKKRKGHATGLLKKVTKYADKHGLTLRLVANGYGKKTFKTNVALANFYARFGFSYRENQAIEMIRSQEIHSL